MASQTHQLHFVLVPLMAPGHIIPMIDMAKLLAKRSAKVTIVTTPLLSRRFNTTIDRANLSGLSIQLLQLRFPSVEAGLPEGCESMEMLPSPSLFKNFCQAAFMLQEPFEQLFEGLKPTPICIIADKLFAWVADIAKRFQVPRLVFDGMSSFNLLCTHNLLVSKVHESVPETEPFVVPGLPDRIELTRNQLPGALNPGSLDLGDIVDQVIKAEAEAYGVVINSFEELEANYVSEIKKLKGGKVWCIGPLSLCNEDNPDKAQRGNRAAIDEDECLKWLDKQQPGSVVYACLGSSNRLTGPQLIELGSGLEASEKPFIWVIRESDNKDDLKDWIQKQGFEDKNRGRGLVIRGWAPQVLILSHPAVGAFLTHCGWNSTMESICAGLPMITWPLFADQFFNEKLVVEVLKIGVGIGSRGAVHPWEDERVGVAVKGETVAEAVRRVMEEEEEEARERRKRVRQLGEWAKAAVEEGGSSYLNLTLLIQDVIQQASKKVRRVQS